MRYVTLVIIPGEGASSVEVSDGTTLAQFVADHGLSGRQLIVDGEGVPADQWGNVTLTVLLRSLLLAPLRVTSSFAAYAASLVTFRVLSDVRFYALHHFYFYKMMKKVQVIGLPCSGKTTAITSYISKIGGIQHLDILGHLTDPIGSINTEKLY